MYHYVIMTMKTTMEKLWWFSTFTTYVELNAFSIIREGLYELKSFRQTHIYFHKSRHFSSIAIFHFCMRWALLNHMTNWVPFPSRSLLLLSFRQKREITVSRPFVFPMTVYINKFRKCGVCLFFHFSIVWHAIESEVFFSNIPSYPTHK